MASSAGTPGVGVALGTLGGGHTSARTSGVGLCLPPDATRLTGLNCTKTMNEKRSQQEAIWYAILAHSSKSDLFWFESETLRSRFATLASRWPQHLDVTEQHRAQSSAALERLSFTTLMPAAGHLEVHPLPSSRVPRIPPMPCRLHNRPGQGSCGRSQWHIDGVPPCFRWCRTRA